MRADVTSLVLGLLLAGAGGPAIGAPLIADHHAADAFGDIPASSFQLVREHYRFFYGRTSHGSQVGTGLQMLAAEDPLNWAGVTMAEFGVDLGLNGDTTFVPFTRDYLGAHPECNAVLWAWCGGLSTNTPTAVDAYLQAMNRLESDHPGVLFVYMTGHLDGSGAAGTLARNNEQIRAWCTAHDKVLFDFADIESYDPDGAYHPDDSDACAWCSAWCAAHSCPACADCAHSHCLNCYRKGRAFWWLMARTLGWQPADTAVGGNPGGPAAPAHPNPFGPATTLAYRMPEAGVLRLRIVDIAGRTVATLADGHHAAGLIEFTWRGRTDGGEPAPAGVYFARFAGPGNVRTERLVLVR